MDVTTIQNYDHQDGFMTEQVVVLASKERVKEILEQEKYRDVYAVGFSKTVSILVNEGITVIPTVGFFVDGFNNETIDMIDLREDAPGTHYDGEPIMRLRTIDEIIAD